MTERCFSKCLLCDEDTPSKYDLIQHIYRHLSYRKYQCASCTERFYSEEERDLHCIETGHFHTHGLKLTPYCELYVNQLLKDAEYAVRHGMEAVVEHRIKASLTCDVAMNKLSSCAGDTESPIESSSPKQETKSSSSEKARNKKSKAADDVERNKDASCGNDQHSPRDVAMKKSPSSACESELVEVPPTGDKRKNKKKKRTQETSNVAENKTLKTAMNDERNSAVPHEQEQLPARVKGSGVVSARSQTTTLHTTDSKSKADNSGVGHELRNVSFSRQKKPFPWHQLPHKLKGDVRSCSALDQKKIHRSFGYKHGWRSIPVGCTVF